MRMADGHGGKLFFALDDVEHVEERTTDHTQPQEEQQQDLVGIGPGQDGALPGISHAHDVHLGHVYHGPVYISQQHGEGQTADNKKTSSPEDGDLHREIVELREENRQLRVMNSLNEKRLEEMRKLKTEYEELRQTNDTLRKTIDTLKQPEEPEEPKVMKAGPRRPASRLTVVRMKVRRPLAGMSYIPKINCICVVHRVIGEVWLYPMAYERPISHKLLGLSNPNALSVMSQEEMKVAIADYAGRSIHFANLTSDLKIAKGSHEIWKLEYTPSDVTMDLSSSRLLVGGEDNMVHVYSLDGEELQAIKSVPSTSSNSCLIPNLVLAPHKHQQCIIVTCERENKIVWLKSDSTTLFLYDGNQTDQQPLSLPTSTVVDQQGRLLVADCNNHRIQMISGDNKFIGHLLQECHGLELPSWLYLDYSDESSPRLFVSCREDIQVYDYKKLCAAHS